MKVFLSLISGQIILARFSNEDFLIPESSFE
jgi:hypothetical protein